MLVIQLLTQRQDERLLVRVKTLQTKGTGNARVWDRRSPIRVGWGVVFWPRNERNYTKSMNKKSKQLALSSILTLKAKNKNIVWLKDFDMKEPKTKEALNILTNIWLNKEKTLFVLNEKNLNLIKSFRNLNNVKYLLVDYLNQRIYWNTIKYCFGVT